MTWKFIFILPSCLRCEISLCLGCRGLTITGLSHNLPLLSRANALKRLNQTLPMPRAKAQSKHLCTKALISFQNGLLAMVSTGEHLSPLTSTYMITHSYYCKYTFVKIKTEHLRVATTVGGAMGVKT